METTARKGQCNQCGACCRWAGSFLVQLPSDTLEWLRVRDPEISIKPIEGERDSYAIMIPHRCVHLIDMPDGKTACDLHDSDKPAMCREFPTVDDELEHGCGFHFL